SIFFTVTVAPATAAPLESVTVPLILAVFCPKAAIVNENIATNSSQGEKATFLDISHSSFLESTSEI
ncbi:MAG TPA: hypothetical protein VJ848_02860, partial [Candidatus Angelobacter sp.]|nr:hypothetical protein [Candidatus Angelobacter sp.]